MQLTAGHHSSLQTLIKGQKKKVMKIESACGKVLFKKKKINFQFLSVGDVSRHVMQQFDHSNVHNTK